MTISKTIGECTDQVFTCKPEVKFGTGEFTYIDISAVDNEEKEIRSTTTVRGHDAPSRARQVLKKDDVLVSTVRPNLNAVAIVPEKLEGSIASTGYCVLRSKTEVLLPRFLFYWVRTKKFISNMTKLATGASYPAVSDSIIKASKIPLPPLHVQKQIADTLDKADALRRKDQELLQKYDELAQAIFYDMFGLSRNTKNKYKSHRLNDVTTLITKGESPGWQGYEYQESGVLFITSENVGLGSLILEGKRKFIPIEFHRKLKRSQLIYGDVLINLVGASIGRCSIYNLESLDANINQAVALIRCHSEMIIPEYLYFLLLTDMMQREIKGGIVESARANISLKDLQDLVIPIPPLQDQVEFSNRLNYCKMMSGLSSYQSPLFEALEQRFFS